MKIGVIHPGNNWILSIIAKRLCAADPDHFESWPRTSLFHYDLKGCLLDGWLYWDVQNCFHPAYKQRFPDAIHVGAFTHLDKDENESFRFGWDRCDGIIHMAQRYYDRFVEQGWYRPEQMAVIRPGEVVDMPLKKIRIGICQRGEHVGKGAMFFPEVIEGLPDTIKDGLKVIFCGKGWTDGGNYHGVTIAKYPEDSWQNIFYDSDYLLIPSLWEGGPMSLLEALAAGIPIIAADVGWVRDFYNEPVGDTFLLYPPGDVAELQRILTCLVQQHLDRRAVVEKMSYRRYAADVLAFFERISNGQK